MDDQSRFAHIVNAFICSAAAPKRGSGQPAEENAAEISEYQSQRADQVRGRLVSFGDGADSADDGEMEVPG